MKQFIDAWMFEKKAQTIKSHGLFKVTCKSILENYWSAVINEYLYVNSYIYFVVSLLQD